MDVTDPATLIPSVYSRNSLGRYLIIGLTKYLLENEYKYGRSPYFIPFLMVERSNGFLFSYERFFVRPVDVALARITNTIDDLGTADIDLCTVGF